MSNSERPALSLTQLVKTYVSLVGGPALALWVILQFGSLLTSNRSPAHSTTAIRAAASQTQAATAAAPSPNPDLPLRIVVILVAARLVGLLVRRIGQPHVVGERLAGIARRPSILAHMPSLRPGGVAAIPAHRRA